MFYQIIILDKLFINMHMTTYVQKYNISLHIGSSPKIEELGFSESFTVQDTIQYQQIDQHVFHTKF